MKELHRKRIQAILEHLSQEEVWSFISEKPHGFYSEPIRKLSAEIPFEGTETPHIAAQRTLEDFNKMLEG